MQFIKSYNRYQTFFSTLEDQVAADNPVRLIDAFIDKIDLAKMGFPKTKLKMLLKKCCNKSKIAHQVTTK